MQNGDKKDIYLPPKLQKRLRELTQPPLTVVEAGSGFGKTTAVMEHLTTGPRRKRRLFVRTLCGGSAEKPWEELCSLLSNICPKNADYLRKFGEPAQDTSPSPPSCRIRCEEKTTRRQLSPRAIPGAPNQHARLAWKPQPVDSDNHPAVRRAEDDPLAARVSHIQATASSSRLKRCAVLPPRGDKTHQAELKPSCAPPRLDRGVEPQEGLHGKWPLRELPPSPG
ncbi:MAG: hypothetical protein ACLUEQ_10360 [Cloacibacillus evryensis]